MAGTKRQTGIYAEGVRELQRTMTAMGKEISEDARKASTGLADQFLTMVESRAASPAEQEVIDAFRVYRDRVPKVGFSASAATGASGGATAGELFFGTEFGGQTSPTTQQFPAKNARGYFFYPTLRAEGPELAQDWIEEILELLTDDWNRGAARARRKGAP